MVSSGYSPVRVFSTASPDPCDARRDGSRPGDGVAPSTTMVRPRRMIRDGHPACRLKPASPAVPAASAEEENKKNNDDKRLGIHDVKPFQYDGFGLGFSTISAFARMHIIWGDAIVPASSRSASSRAGRSFRPTGLMKRNERIADLIEKAGREEAAASASRDRRRGSGRLAPCFPVLR